MLLLTDEEIQDAVGGVMIDEGLSQIAKDNITRDSIVAKAQLKKVVEWMRANGEEQAGYIINEETEGEELDIKVGGKCFVIYPTLKDWQALLKEIE